MSRLFLKIEMSKNSGPLYTSLWLGRFCSLLKTRARHICWVTPNPYPNPDPKPNSNPKPKPKPCRYSYTFPNP